MLGRAPPQCQLIATDQVPLACLAAPSRHPAVYIRLRSDAAFDLASMRDIAVYIGDKNPLQVRHSELGLRWPNNCTGLPARLPLSARPLSVKTCRLAPCATLP